MTDTDRTNDDDRPDAEELRAQEQMAEVETTDRTAQDADEETTDLGGEAFAAGLSSAAGGGQTAPIESVDDQRD